MQQTFRTAPAPLDWRFICALALMVIGTLTLGVLGLIWCYEATYFGGHLGFALQMGAGACLMAAGWLGGTSGSDE